MHSIDSKCVLEPSYILSAGVYMCNFQPGNLTGRGSEGVKDMGLKAKCHNFGD